MGALYRGLGLLLAAGCLVACGTGAPEGPPVESQQGLFFGNLLQLCGQAYRGTVVSEDAADADFAAEALVMHIRDCEPDTIRIPFHVGENRSRTWVISRTDAGLRLKHDHRHEDGGEDAVTQYGGDAVSEGSAGRQEFPADAYSKELFAREGLAASTANVWAIELEPRRAFAYELRRPGRHFRVEFDLTAAVATPPAAWGAGG